MICFDWVDASIAPDDWYAPILYVSANNKLCTLKDTVGWYGGKPDESPHFSNWEWYREKYHIKYWIYQSEVLPNE